MVIFETYYVESPHLLVCFIEFSGTNEYAPHGVAYIFFFFVLTLFMNHSITLIEADPLIMIVGIKASSFFLVYLRVVLTDYWIYLHCMCIMNMYIYIHILKTENYPNSVLQSFCLSSKRPILWSKLSRPPVRAAAARPRTWLPLKGALIFGHPIPAAWRAGPRPLVMAEDVFCVFLFWACAHPRIYEGGQLVYIPRPVYTV